jgi:hypothetical protein
MFIGLASAFEEHVIDLREVSGTLEKKYGKPVELATRSTYNPLTKKQFALSDMRVPDPRNYHKKVWTDIGMPSGPATYEDLVKAAPEIKPQIIGPARNLDIRVRAYLEFRPTSRSGRLPEPGGRTWRQTWPSPHPPRRASAMPA